MNSDRSDRSNAYRAGGREERLSHPAEGYNGGYGASEHEPFQHGEGRRVTDYGEDANRHSSAPGNPHGTPGGEYSDYGPGYSTANDFSGQEPARGRLHHPQHGREYRGYDEEDYPRYREMYKRTEYPDTYRSAMSGYMSEHVGYDSGRRDYKQNTNSGNLYGNRYGWPQRSRPGNYRRERGYMSEQDYDRGSPFYGENSVYGRSYRARIEEGPHKGKGPRDYRRADNRIQEEINDRLTDDPWVDASEVNVKVQNSEVALTGTVDDRAAKRRAEDVAESVSGVIHVENLIRVRAPASTNPGLIVTPY